MPANTRSERTVLVIGATGNQGSAVVEQLLGAETEFDILALTRDRTTDRARALAGQGDAVELVEGDLGESDTLSEPTARADAVFAVMNVWTHGHETLVDYAQTLTDVVEDANDVEQVVYSGIADQGRETGIPHFDTSKTITDTLRAGEFPLTVLNPVFFMENWEVMLEDIADGTLAFPLAEGQQHQQTSYYDVARATRVALEHPDEFVGTEQTIVSDVNTLAEVTETVNEVGGFAAEPYHVPIENAYEEFGREFGAMTEWWQENDSDRSFFGDPGDTEETFGFEPLSFEEYLRNNGWGDGKQEPTHIVGWAKAMNG